jgi:hypothetical protein
MTRSLKALALAATLAVTAGGVRAAPVSYVYNLQPGELDFTLDSTALNAQGYGTVDPTLGLLSLTLRLGGQTFQAASDAFYPTQPYLTLVNSNVSFAVFSPVNAAGTSYNFYAFQNAVSTTFDYTFTGSDNLSIAGTGTLTAQAVPEPAAVTLLAVGLSGLMILRRRA